MKTNADDWNTSAIMYNKIYKTSSKEIDTQSAGQHADSRTNKIISALSKELLEGPINWLIRF
jgi:hypothetical protein